MKETKFNSERPHIILVLPAVIAGGVALAGSGLSAASQGRQNKRAMQFQREMFDKTNAYNHPLAQRKRLEEAGLNPNLIYGSSPGQSTGNTSQPAQPDLKGVDFTTAGEQVGGALAQIYQIKHTQAGIDVNEARTENLKADTINKGIESLNSALRAGSGAIDLKTKQRLYENTIKTAEEKLRNLSVQTGYTENKDAREQMITDQTVQKISQEISNLKTKGKTLNSESIIKAIDAKLYQDYGLKPHDPYYMRILHNILEKINFNPFN